MQNNFCPVKISLIVSIYNMAEYLERCIQSIYAQTFTDYEIILVNDGSTDNSLELCKSYAEKDKRITVINKENGGLGSARNAGMTVAQGEYITFPDADDWLEPDYCKDLYELAKQGDYDVVVSGANNYSQDLKLINNINYKKMHFNTREECWANIMTFFPTTLLFDVVWNKIYKTVFLKSNGLLFSDLRRSQDAYFNLEVFDKINSIIATDKAYYNYLNNDLAKVNQKFPKNYIDFNIAYYQKLKEIFIKHGIYKDEIKKQYDSSFVETIYATINMFDNPRWNLDKSEQKKYIVDILKRNEVIHYIETASIREDVLWQYNIIRDQDLNKILKLHRKELLKNKLRKNKILMKFYHFLRK